LALGDPASRQISGVKSGKEGKEMEKKGEGRNKGQKNTTEEERGGKRQGKGVLYQILDRIYAHSYRQSTLLSTYGSAEI